MLEDVEFDELISILEAAAEWEEAVAEHPEPDDPLHPPVT